MPDLRRVTADVLKEHTNMGVPRSQCLISDILNPLPHTIGEQCQISGSPSILDDSEPHTPASPSKKQKLVKDGASFVKNRPKGEVRYPPCEHQPQYLLREHEDFHLHPIGSIMCYSRHIPYTSEKKSFMGKTGRKSFEGKNEYTQP